MSEELKINMPLFNINEEAELENNLSFHLDEFTNEIMRTMTRDKEIEILKKVIKKQQKEIEEKRIIIFAGAEKVKQLEKEIQRLEKDNDTLSELVIVNEDKVIKELDLISKDKIREKIEELKKQDELSKLSHNYLIIGVLQELLEEK